MALSDVYELRCSGEILGENWNLVWHMLRTDSLYDAEDMKDAWTRNIYQLLLNCMTADVTLTEISARNLGDPLDFYSAGAAGTGALGVTATISPFATATIKFPRRRTDMHHGYKRIPGVDESYVSEGVISGAQLTALQALGAEAVTDWDLTANPGVPVANYIVVKRVLDGGVYRLPKTDGELVHYAPNSYVVNTFLTTQNSRKFS